MATLVFTAIGTLIGGPIGGAIGALAGRQIDTMLLGNGAREGPRLNELSVTTSSYGMPIARHFGRMRTAGQIIWATDLVEHRDSHGNGKGQPSTISYSYSASFAVALSSRPILDVRRIWADGKLLRGAAGDLKTSGVFRLYRGDGAQSPDPLLAAAEGVSRCPAYTGLAYGVFENLQLGDFGNRIPALTFEVIADAGELTVSHFLDGTIEDVSADVALCGLEGISGDGPINDLLAAISPFYPLDCDACGPLITFRPEREQSAPIMLPQAATSSTGDDFGGKAGFARKRLPETEQPVAVLRYYDIDRDYQPGAQRAPGRPKPGQPRTIELPATLSASSARQLVERASRRAQWARQTTSWRITQLDPNVRPGTTVILPDHPGLWRVLDWEWREHGIDLTLVRLSRLGETPAPADPGRPTPQPDQPIGATALAAFELPWDGNPNTAVPLIMATTSSSSAAWNGAALFADRGDGDLIPLGASGRTRAVLGSATSVLSAATPLAFDRTNSVIVVLVSEEFSFAPATLRQLALGANRALLGSEIIQFAFAEPLGNGRWRLSGLLRGCAGTEHAIGTHLANEPFVLLDGTGTALDPAKIGSVPGTTIAALGLGDSDPVETSITLRGIGQRPPSPVHGACTILPGEEIRWTWVRRARGGWQWLDGVETPLNEQKESYTVVFGTAAAPIARWETASSSLTLPAGQVNALIAAHPDALPSVRQNGDLAVSDPLPLPLP